MTRSRILGAVRLAFTLLALTAVGTQLALGLQREIFVVANFFSFFTIESNLIGAFVLLLTGVGALRSADPGRFALLRGAATLYMTTTGIIYFLLLRGLEASLQTPVPWINTVLHYVMPLVLLIDWFVSPARRITFTRALVWLLFPLAYVAYSLIRGSIVGWYPYPFLNANEQSYG